MYLHLGNDIIVRSNDIIGIFDLDNTTVEKRTRSYLKKVQEAGIVVNVSDELPKTFIVCNNKDQNMVYISPISSTTLLKRTSFLKRFSLDKRKVY